MVGRQSVSISTSQALTEGFDVYTVLIGVVVGIFKVSVAVVRLVCVRVFEFRWFSSGFEVFRSIDCVERNELVFITSTNRVE